MEGSSICVTCGTQFPENSDLPIFCPVCADDRQYIPGSGQAWTDPKALADHHAVQIKRVHEKLFEFSIIPSFAIGQRAFLLLSPHGNVLWDCIPLLDEPAADFIKAKGGLAAIAVSHPHYYSNMNHWAEVFDCPVYIHEADESWIFDRGPRIMTWTGTEKELWDGMKIIRTGGHFPGSCILHVSSLLKGTVLCGDSLQVSRNRKHIAIMYSYPNLVPLPAAEIWRIKKQLAPLLFDAIYGAFGWQNIATGAKAILENSFEKYAV